LTAYVAAKPAKPAKPGKAKSTVRKARTSTSKHTSKAKSAKSSSKHAAPDAHQKHVLHMEHEAHLRGWARPSDLLPSCAAEAVAMSLRLAGQRVSDDEVAGLHWLAGGDARQPVSIAGALAAAARSGLAGCCPLLLGEFPPHVLDVPGAGIDQAGLRCRVGDYRQDDCRVSSAHALILGVDRPGPHCVLATPAGWWSWGRLYSPWPCAIEEVWGVPLWASS
jgi:hypothetical protein